MEVNNRDKILDEIWRLNRKADQMRSFHGEILDDLRLVNTLSTIYVTIGTAIGAATIFAKIPDKYLLCFGLYLLSVFIVSFIVPVLNINKLIEDRVKALNLYSVWIRDAQNFGNIEILNLANEQAVIRQKELKDLYNNIANQTVSINNKRFNNLKQKHLQKIAISKELDKNPFESIRSIRKRLKNRCIS